MAGDDSDVVDDASSVDDGFARDGVVGADAERQLGPQPRGWRLGLCRRQRLRPSCTLAARSYRCRWHAIIKLSFELCSSCHGRHRLLQATGGELTRQQSAGVH
eukprot:2954851-Rhodomonas_salina.2